MDQSQTKTPPKNQTSPSNQQNEPQKSSSNSNQAAKSHNQSEAYPIEESSIGLAAPLAAALGYIPLLGLVFLFLEKKSRFVLFHLWQSVLLVSFISVIQIVVSLFSFIPKMSFIINMVGLFIMFCYLLLAVLLLVQALTGKYFQIPLLGIVAYNQAIKTQKWYGNLT